MGKELAGHFEKLRGVDVLPFHQGEEIVAQGNLARNLLIIQSGHILSSRISTGGETVTYLPGGPNCILGTEVMAGSNQSNHYENTVIALDDGQALRIPEPIFREALEKDPQAAILALDQMIEQLAKDDRQRSWLRRLGKVRVASTIREFQRLLEDNTIKVSEDDIGHAANLARENTSRAIAWLKRLGVLETGTRGRYIHIISPELLEQAAKGNLKLK